MCGFCGEFRFDGRSPDLDRVRSMLLPLARRGPDDEGLFSEGPVAFGHRRLSIIDLSQLSHQPMVDPATGLTIVFNGTIYNYPELRKILITKGHTFFSQGDTEVILRSYIEWGEDCVQRLHGMFAFSIWDTRKKVLFLARDRMGIKPLYFSQNRSCIRFASNTQSLLATGKIDTAIDPVALHNIFTLHAVTPAPATILQGIRKLDPGYTMTIDLTGRVIKKRYWELISQRPTESLSDHEWVEKIHASLQQAVKRRLDIADVPVGVLLSGGLDSSLLVALLAEQGVSDLKTFTIGFEDHPEEKGSEFEYSDPVAQHYQTDHQKLLVPNDAVLQRIPEAIDAMSEPMFAQDAVAFYLLSEQVSKKVKVVQSGQGADEVFAGYFWYPQMHAAQGSAIQRFAPYYFDRSHDEYTEMVSNKYRGGDYTTEIIKQRLADIKSNKHIDAVLNMDVTMLVVDDPVKRVDNMTMAWGLEARVPFLDHELVELAASMPPELKLAQQGKGVLKTIARGLIPDAVIDRPKGYFPMPALKYVRGEFLDFMRDIINSDKCRERGIYSRKYVNKLLDNPEEHHTKLQGSKLWHLVALEYWLQRHI